MKYGSGVSTTVGRNRSGRLWYHFANSGAEALELAAAENPDLILLDVRLPDWDGFEACRRRFDEFLEQEWRRAVRSGLPLSILMLDLDFFKSYPDAHGPPAGDACLRQIAGVLRTALQRPPDLAARYGGEEFACGLPETDAAGAGWVAQRIQAGIAALALPHPQSPLDTCVIVSQGVFTGWPARGGVAADWVQAADRLLYAAKTGGRNRIMDQAVELTLQTEGTRPPTARL